MPLGSGSGINADVMKVVGRPMLCRNWKAFDICFLRSLYDQPNSSAIMSTMRGRASRADWALRKDKRVRRARTSMAVNAYSWRTA